MSEINLAHLYQTTIYFIHSDGKKDHFNFSENGYLEEQSTYKLIKEAEKSFKHNINKKIKESIVPGAYEYIIKQYKNKKLNDFKIEDIKVEYKGQARWWLTWFAHHSLCKFDTEQEAFSDFESFLEEKNIHLNYSSYPGSMLFEEKKEGSYCAMGAEDRWRWKLCTCKYCKKSGRTIIGH